MAQVPETFIIDPDGIVVLRWAGAIDAVTLRCWCSSSATSTGRHEPRVVVKRWPGWVLLVFVVVGFLAYGATRDAGARTPEERVEEITKRLACPMCDGETVYESANTASASIRAEIKTQVTAADASDDDIVAYIVQQFGAQTQLLPKASGFESLVWVIPGVALVCAGVGLFFAFRRWRTNVDTVPDDADRARGGRAALAAADRTTGPAMNPDRLAELEEERSFLLRSIRDIEARVRRGRRRRGRLPHAARRVRRAAPAAVLREIEDGRSALVPEPKRPWWRRVAIIGGTLVVARRAGPVRRPVRGPTAARARRSPVASRPTRSPSCWPMRRQTMGSDPKALAGGVRQGAGDRSAQRGSHHLRRLAEGAHRPAGDPTGDAAD